MIIEKDLQKILNQLGQDGQITIPFEGSDINLRVLDENSKLSLITSVYYGGNYIPKSVRRCLSHKSPFPYISIKTFLTVDEQNFQVYLNYLGAAQPLSHIYLRELLEEFGILAEKWRTYLDEHDRNDLVYVRVNK